MSRSDSPSKGNSTDEETIKKLKAIVIKEKRINKENSKIISNLNNDLNTKSQENEHLINQIKRLSENLGSLQDTDSEYLEKIQQYINQINQLNKDFEEAQSIISEKNDAIYNLNKNLEICQTIIKENENLKEKISYLNQENDKNIETSLNNIKIMLCGKFNKNNLKVVLNDQDNLDKISDNIIESFQDMKSHLNNQVESNSLLQDGFDKIVLKCNDLEGVIDEQNQKIQLHCNFNEKFNELHMESQQKDEQIKRLEELIEDNRNISRALETERDQLQNDLVDLRQRHEEKEGYLMEEYREAKLNLESYRIFNDKESAYKINEIERLRKLLDQYQHEGGQEKFMNDCRFCREFELLATMLKERFEIVDESFCHEDVVGKIVEKFDNLQAYFDGEMEKFRKMETDYRDKLEKVNEQLQVFEEVNENSEKSSKEIEELRESIFKDEKEIELLRREIDEKKKIIDESNSKLVEKEESNLALLEENGNLKGLVSRLEEDSGQKIEVMQKLREVNVIMDKQIESLERELEEKKEIIESINFKGLKKEEFDFNSIKGSNHLEEDCENRDKEIHELQKSMGNWEREIEFMKKELEERNNIIEDINLKLVTKEKLSFKLLKKNENLIGLISKLENDSRKKDTEIHEDIVNMEKEMLKLRESIGTGEKEIESLRIELGKQKKMIDASNSDVLQKEEFNLTLLKENGDLKGLVRQFETNTETLEKKIGQLRKSIADTEKEIELQTDLDESKKIIAASNLKLLEEKESKIKLIAENENLQRLISEVKQMFQTDIKTESSSTLVDCVRHVVNYSENLVKEGIKYKLEISKEQDDVRNLQIENERLSKMLSEMEKNFTEMEKIQQNETENRYKLENENENSNDREKELQESIELLRRELDERNEIIESINSKLLKKEELNFILMNENANLQGLISKLEETFNIDGETDQASSLIDCVRNVINGTEDLTNELNQYKLEISKQNETFYNIKSENEKLSEKLSTIEKSFSGSDLMNLEMAEFDKTLINLNSQLLAKSSQIEDLETILKSKEQLIISFQEQLTSKENHIVFLEDRSNRMKQLLVKTKKELADCKSELENSKISNNYNQDQLQSCQNQLEENKFQLGEALKEKEKIIERHSTMSKKLETISKNKDLRLADFKSQLELALNSNQLLQREFESYKIKAQNALSTQQRPKSTFGNFMSAEVKESKNLDYSDTKDFKKLIIDKEEIIKDLKIELQENEDKIFVLNNELESIRWDNEKWINKYKLLVKDNNDLNVKLQAFVIESQEVDKIQKNSYSNLMERFELEKVNIGKMNIAQMESVRLNYENKISNFEQKLEEIENEKIKYQEEIWDCREQLRNAEYKLSQITLSTDHQISSLKYQPMPNHFKIPLEHERQQGEGMETTSELDDADSLNVQHFSPALAKLSRIYNNSLVPLDKLLNSQDDDMVRLADEQLSLVTGQAQSYKKRVEHLTELLNDSEATVARLTEQAIILKCEIRRLEKNRERDNKLTDEPTHEYLKNVIMKFLDHETKPDERGQLVPVLVTLLSLDLNEKENLLTFSKLIQFERKQNTDGWSSYFNWAGNS